MKAQLALLDQAASAVALLGVVAFGLARLAALARAPRPPARHVAAVAALLAVGLAARLLIPPAFVHSNLHGYSLLDQVLAFPTPAGERAYFGQGSFVVLGLLERVLGGGWRGVVVANALANLGAVALAAALAARVGPRGAGLAVLALGALWPGLVRAAASEDAHNVGLLFGMAALVAADGARREGAPSWSRLGLAASAAVLALYCRHPFVAWPAWTLALALPRGRVAAWLRSPVTLALLAAAALLCAPRALELLQPSKEAATYRAMALFAPLFGDARFLLRHPLLRPDESLLLTPLLALGLAAGLRARDRVVGVLGLAVAFYAVLTLAFSVHPSYGEEYAFRLPLLGLVLVPAGAGAARAFAWLRARLAPGAGPRARAVLAAALLGVLVIAPAAGLARVWADEDPQAQEHALVAGHPAPRGPAGVIAFPRLGGPFEAPSYDLPVAALEAEGWRPHDPKSGDPPPRGATFFQGLGCFAWSIFELGRLPSVGALLDYLDGLGPDALADLSADFWDDPEAAVRRLGAEPPRGLRPECVAAIPPGATFEPWGEVIVHRQQLPHAYFSERRLPIGAWRAPAGGRR